MKRVVITGIGAVTPLGNDIGTTWGQLIHKSSGIGTITKFDPAGMPSRIAGEVKKFNPETYLSKKDVLRLDPFVHYAVAAACMAAEDAGIIRGNGGAGFPALTCAGEGGVVIGSSRGGICSMEKALHRHLIDGKPFSAYLMSSSTINMAAASISMKFSIRGPALGVSTACASGTTAIGEARDMIRSGKIDFAFAGGSEAPVCKLAVGGYGASGSLSQRNDEPHKASRPFDADRDGFVISEGAGVLVLEELGHALKRGAEIYAEIAGYGTSSDACHQTRPDSDGESSAIIMALRDADVLTNDVDYINAHGTSTPLGDSEEVKAIQRVFGMGSGNMYVSSCKSMLGHMLGAAGAVEAAITALTINRGLIPPTINLDKPDRACHLNYATMPIDGDVTVAVSNSFGFGGVNAVLVLRKYRSS